MSVEYGVSTFVPYVFGVYSCRCGRRSIRHGLRAGAVPAGWTEHAGDTVCKKCAEVDAARRRRQRAAT